MDADNDELAANAAMAESVHKSLPEQILERTLTTLEGLPDFNSEVVAQLRSLLVAGRAVTASHVEQVLASSGSGSG